MNRVRPEGKHTQSLEVADTAHTRLAGSQRQLARGIWLALVLPGVGLFLAGLPVYYQQLQRACADALTCGNLNGSLSAAGLQALEHTGLSASAYAALLTLFFALITAIWWTAGFLLFWRRSDDWM